MKRFSLILVGVICMASMLSAQAAVAVQGAGSRNANGTRTSVRLVTVNFENVPVSQAVQAIVEQSGVVVLYSPKKIGSKRVTYSASNVRVEDALVGILRGTGIQVEKAQDGTLTLLPGEGEREVKGTGIILGKVYDAKSGKGVSGANVSVGNDNRGIISGDDGSYRVVGIASGTHVVTVRLVGYSKQTRQVTVGEGATVAVDFKLEPSANVLDQVIVTGTVARTELRAVPNAITVITNKELEERGITRIEQLFRGDIPGLFAQNQGSNALLDEVTMSSRGATAFASSSLGSNPIKTYIDGIEIADPKYLSQIDPKSIDRIEILTGPQASTIYGSNAINGVMQVFTNRGNTSRPQVTINLLSGFLQNNFSSSLTPQHDYSGNLSGVEGRLSYNAGGSWNYVGPWTPAKQLTRTSGFGGARLELPTRVGPISADITLRRTLTHSLQRGNKEQTFTGYAELGWYQYSSSFSGLASPSTRELIGQTMGLTLSYNPLSWWSHEFGWGSDISDAETRVTARGYAFVSDTNLSLSRSYLDRYSLRYTTTARIPVSSAAHFTITGGADAWKSLSSTMSSSTQTLTGTLTGTTSISRQPAHNTGGFIQTQLGLRDQLFFTYGLRAEWNPNYGEEAQPNMTPRYGVAYSKDFNFVTAKLRGSYGHSTRPPQPKLKAAQTIAEFNGANWASNSAFFLPFYGEIFDRTFANPELGPEFQRGGEGGLELYFGTRGSLVVTRYNQTVDHLIELPAVDSIRTLVPCISPCSSNSLDAQGYGYWRQFQNLNIGSIRNQGWELQGSLVAGPLTTRGTYSWTKSRVIGITPRYQAFFTNNSRYQPGAAFRYQPEHTWAFGVTYNKGSSSVALNTMGIGRVTTQQNAFAYNYLSSSIRLPQNRFNVIGNSLYVAFNAPYSLTDLSASHRFGSHVEGLLQVQNLADKYVNDFVANYASLGRQLKAGIHLRTQ